MQLVISLTGAATGGRSVAENNLRAGRPLLRRHAFHGTVVPTGIKRRFHYATIKPPDDRDARDHRWYLTQISLSLLRQKNSPTFNDSLRNNFLLSNVCSGNQLRCLASVRKGAGGVRNE